MTQSPEPVDPSAALARILRECAESIHPNTPCETAAVHLSWTTRSGTLSMSWKPTRPEKATPKVGTTRNHHAARKGGSAAAKRRSTLRLEAYQTRIRACLKVQKAFRLHRERLRSATRLRQAAAATRISTLEAATRIQASTRRMICRAGRSLMLADAAQQLEQHHHDPHHAAATRLQAAARGYFVRYWASRPRHENGLLSAERPYLAPHRRNPVPPKTDNYNSPNPSQLLMSARVTRAQRRQKKQMRSP